jgi:glycosyltransferase involved in cell wall biosynthesis
MAGERLNVLILAGHLSCEEGSWPLSLLLDELQRRGCDLQVLCISKPSGQLNDRRAIEIPALGNRWLRSFAIRDLCSHEQSDRPHLIHVVDDDMADASIALAETAALPYIQTVSRFGTLASGLRLSRRWCRRIVVPNPDLADELIDELGVPADGIAVVRPGMTPYPPRTSRTTDARVPVIGTGGPLEEASGMMTFLDAASLVVEADHDVEFVIASQGKQQIALRHRIQRLRIAERVTVADYPNAGSRFWGALDIYCQPAVVSSAGRTLIQAFGHAFPCIATDVKGLRLLIDHNENGLSVPPRDPAALAAAMISLLDHPEEARRLGAHALERARAIFDPAAEADRLVDLYHRAARKPARSIGL